MESPFSCRQTIGFLCLTTGIEETPSGLEGFFKILRHSPDISGRFPKKFFGDSSNSFINYNYNIIAVGMNSRIAGMSELGWDSLWFSIGFEEGGGGILVAATGVAESIKDQLGNPDEYNQKRIKRHNKDALQRAAIAAALQRYQESLAAPRGVYVTLLAICK